MIFFVSDTHFNHNAILKYCNRPFSSAEEMDEIIIEKWNKIVSPKDTIYHLGDFSFGNAEIYLKRLNGYKFITLGDHDKDLEKIIRTYTSEAIQTNFKTTIYNRQVLSVKYQSYEVFCLHWCMRVWPKSHYNSWHVFGHSHGKLNSIGKSHDVGVDNNNFEPLSFDELVEIMRNKQDNFNLVRR